MKSQSLISSLNRKYLFFMLPFAVALLFFCIALQSHTLLKIIASTKATSIRTDFRTALEKYAKSIEDSARLAAYSGHSSYENTYYESVDKFQLLIGEKSAVKIVLDENEKEALRTLAKSYIRRSQLDSRIFFLLRDEKKNEAISIIESLEYETLSLEFLNNVDLAIVANDLYVDKTNIEIKSKLITSLIVLLFTLLVVGFLFANWGKHVVNFNSELEKAVNEKTWDLDQAQAIAKIGSWSFDLTTQEQKWSIEHYRIFEIFPTVSADKLYQLYRDKIHPQDLSKLDALLEAAKTSGQGFVYDHRALFEEGARVKYLKGIAHCIKNEKGVPIRLTGTCQDLTEQELSRQALELERAKSVHNSKLASLGEMSAGIAHEINNPLALISGNIPLLDKFKSDEAKFHSKLETIQKAADRIEKIVKGLKKFSRSTTGSQFKVELIPSILEEVMTITEAKSRRHSVSITLDIQPGLAISCDMVEIEQVLVNLINNGIDAIKASDERWLKINAFAENEQVVIQVVDSGLGISHEIEQKLFQPFFTTKVVGEGTGLGLSIAKGILDSHKASIRLNRNFKNTCFEIRFKKMDLSEVSNAV